MLQKTNTVFVGKKLNTSGASLAVGDIVVVNAATGAPVATASIASVGDIQLGYVKAIGATDAAANIVKTQVISKSKVTSKVYSVADTATEASTVINFTGVTISAGKRYVLRVIYTDLYEHPGQFTHTYEVIAASGETIDTIAAKFKALINAHKTARVTAAINAIDDTLTITAKKYVDYAPGAQGKEAITPYSQVQMKVVMYFTDPSSNLSSNYNQISGLSIVTTPAKPGKGNPYIVRDREQDALGYKGITYRTTWPIIKPELTVDLSKAYQTLVIEFEKQYQSPDNQYVKSAPLSSEVYIQNDAAAGTDASDLNTALNTWLAA